MGLLSLIFRESDHSYKSANDDNIKWISVTTLTSYFKEPFDAKKVAKKVSKRKNSKWYGMKPKDIENIWKKESERAMKLGTFYHNQREFDICNFASMKRQGVTVPVFSPILGKELGIKHAPKQKLDPGIYPEHMVYLKSAGICGQSDLVEVVNGKVTIIDYKTNKEIKMNSYKDWEGISQKMQFPLSHIEDCNFNHYALQLSIYMYIIIKHNPKLRPGNMFIHHVQFEETGKNEYGYPITNYTLEGDPVLKNIAQIPVPYLKDEVISIIHHLNDNRDKILKK
jgi:ATP-dependent exoDNAse (exonuclease V) beta subunit